MKVEFGFHLLTHGNYSFDLLKKMTLKLEEEGFYAVTVGDHFYSTPESYTLLEADPNKPDKLDAWTVLAALASVTNRIRLGTCVSPLPLYHPPRLAKIISAIDVISNGRVIFGVGAGWVEEEAKAYGYTWDDFKTRVERTEEALNLIIKLWTEDRTTFKGKYYRVENAPLFPKPVQKPYPPIWFGGANKRIIQLIGKYGDGWILASYGRWSKHDFLELFRRKIEEVKEAVEEVAAAPTPTKEYVCELCGAVFTDLDECCEHAEKEHKIAKNACDMVCSEKR